MPDDDPECKREDCGHLQSVHAEDGMGKCNYENCGCPQMQTFVGGGGSGGGGGSSGGWEG